MLTTQPIMTANQNTILCFRLDALGDLINTTPALTLLRKSNNRIILVTTPHNAKIIASSPLIDEVISYPHKAGLLTTIKLLKKIRQLTPSSAIIFSPKTRAFWLAYLSGAKHRTGIVLADGGWIKRHLNPYLLTQKLRYNRHQAHRQGGTEAHHAYTTLRLAALATNQPITTPPPLALPNAPDLRQHCQTQLVHLPRPLLLCHIDERWAFSSWTTANCMHLIAQLCELPGSLILTSGPKKGAIVAMTQKTYPSLNHTNNTLHPISNTSTTLLCKNPNFELWQALIQQADHVITPECGCVHVAAAWKIPTTVLIAEHLLPGKHVEWAPWQNAHTMVALNQNVSNNITEILASISAYTNDLPRQGQYDSAIT